MRGEEEVLVAPDWTQDEIAVVVVVTSVTRDFVPEAEDWLACPLVWSLRAQFQLFFFSSSTKPKHDENRSQRKVNSNHKPTIASHN